MIKLVGEESCINIINIHINPRLPSNDKIDLLARVIKLTPFDINNCSILARDFNFESKDSHRLDLKAGCEVVSYHPEQDYFYEKALE